MSTPTAYDFSRPGRLSGDLEHLLGTWTLRFCELLPERLAEFLPTCPRFTPGARQANTFADFAEQIPDPAIGLRISLSPAGPETLLVFKRPFVHRLVSDMLSRDAGAAPPDRELTRVELSLCEPLFASLVETLNDAWPAREPAALNLLGIDTRPSRSRNFDPDEQMLRLSLQVVDDDSTDCLWLMPLQSSEHLLLMTLSQRAGANGETRRHVEQRVADVPLEIVVCLGEARVSVSSVASLKAGDVLLLDQRVSDPVTASIAGEHGFVGWAGRQERVQAFQIAEIVGG